jgi:hypothetical protein
MLKYFFAFIMLVHGLIHFMGFAKAFDYGNMKQLTMPISKPIGSLWMITAFLLVIATLLFLLKKEYWWTMALAGAILSQVLIIMSWKDAKFGTIANIVILMAAVFSLGSSLFENGWRKDVNANLRRSNLLATEVLSENDLVHLPQPVQSYLRYVGAVGKPKVKNMYVEMDIQMREKGKDFFKATSKQYNFFDEPSRLFFMKANMFGTTVPGYHRYSNGKAVMDIRFAGLFAIVKKEGAVMDKTETVTLFNDMCLMAPATLIDNRIKWEPMDSNSAKAVFTNHNISISAILYFNEQGQLIDFLSNDRTETNIMKTLPFTTPVHGYTNINGFNLFENGDGVWGYPDGKFVYGQFKLKNIKYNVTQ